MLFILSKFPPPVTTVLFLRTPNFLSFEISFRAVVSQENYAGLVAQRTGLVFSLYFLGALATKLFSAETTGQARLFRDSETNGALGLNCVRRPRHERTVVAAAVLLASFPISVAVPCHFWGQSPDCKVRQRPPLVRMRIKNMVPRLI